MSLESLELKLASMPVNSLSHSVSLLTQMSSPSKARSVKREMPAGFVPAVLALSAAAARPDTPGYGRARAGLIAVQDTLRQHRYRPQIEHDSETGYAYLYAERGRWSQAATLVERAMSLITGSVVVLNRLAQRS